MDATTKGKPCRACTDFQSWAKSQKQTFESEQKIEITNAKPDIDNNLGALDNCPLNRDKLGNHTWNFLHSLAAYYPEMPTVNQKKDMKEFFYLFSKFYPCHTCAEDLQDSLKRSPPKTDSQHQLSQWLCQIHNEINKKLGKSEFDCKLVNERWRDGWADGSCD